MDLKELRKGKALTQVEVAEYLKVDQKTYSNYENKKTEPTLEVLSKLADLFNLSIDELVGRKNPADIGFLTKEQIDIVKKIKLLDSVHCIRLDSYIDRLLEEIQENKETQQLRFK